MTTFTSWDGELYHHGIKGQKWGIRKYQNEDGSLTQAGRQRYLDGGGKLTSRGEKAYARLYRKESRKLKKLQENADMDVQRQKLERNQKVASIAKKIGIGSGGTAAALLGGTAGLKLYKSIAGNKVKNIVNGLYKESDAWVDKGWDRWDKYVKDNPGKRGIDDVTYKELKSYSANAQQKLDEAKATTKQFNSEANKRRSVANALKTAGVVAAGVSAVSFGVSFYNKHQAKLRTQRLTEAGHSKAVEAAKKQMDYMMKEFGGTKYEDLIKNSNKHR
jgi:hypothetical protein